MSIPTHINDLESEKFVESTVTTGQTAVAIVNPDGTNVGASVELSEFPAAAAASDTFANPTTTSVMAMNMGWNGTTWTRIVTGAGAVNTGVQRLTLASDDPAVTSLQLLDDAVFTDDAAFTPGTSKGLIFMAQADETGSDSVDEGDAGALRMTLTRFLKTSQGDLISGEDQTNNLLQVIQKPTAVTTYVLSKDVSSALEASSVSKNSAGNLYRAFGVIDATAPTDIYYIQFLDVNSLPADGSVTHIITPITVNHVNGTDSSFDTEMIEFGVAAASGIIIVLSTTLVNKTISGSYLFATVLYK